MTATTHQTIPAGTYVHYTDAFCVQVGDPSLAERIGEVVGQAGDESVYVTWNDDPSSAVEPSPVKVAFLTPAELV